MNHCLPLNTPVILNINLLKMGFIKNVLASMLSFFIGMVVILVFFVAIIGSIAGSMDETPEIKNNTVLELTLTGDIPDRHNDDPLS